MCHYASMTSLVNMAANYLLWRVSYQRCATLSVANKANV